MPVEILLRTHGARIIDDEGILDDGSRDGHDIYLPNHVESVSHIAVDIGGSLAKVVYFTRSPSGELPVQENPADVATQGILTPAKLAKTVHTSFDPRKLRRRSLPARFPGGRLNFTKFETGDIENCIRFLRHLIEQSAASNGVSVKEMQRSVKLMATGGGARLFNERLQRELGVEVHHGDEMECLITGLNFMTLIPDEVFWYSDELVDKMHAGRPVPQQRADSVPLSAGTDDLPRPSAQPPQYAPMFESDPTPKLPCLLVNIGSGVSILKVDEFGQFERVSGTSLGGGTLWGLLGLLTDAQDFDEMLRLCERGDNSNVDMLVGDIYGPVGLDHLGLKATTIASSFGKVLRWDRKAESPVDEHDTCSASERRRRRFRQEDICRSLLYAISNNIGQIAHMNAEKYKLDRVYFGGCFIRGHQSTISTLSYAIRFWSKGRRRAYFLRHEGYLGAIGAWVRELGESAGNMAPVDAPSQARKSSETKVPTASAPLNPLLAEALGDHTQPQCKVSNDGRDTLCGAAAQGDASDAFAALRALEEVESQSQNGMPEDPEALARLMEQLDIAHSVAETIESRVDALLSRLGDIIPSA